MEPEGREPGHPWWRTALLLLLSTALVGLLVGRATGVVGGDGRVLAEDPPVEQPTASEPPSTAEPDTSPSVRPARPSDPPAKRAQKPRRPVTDQLDLPGGADLAKRVQALLGQEATPEQEEEPLSFRVSSLNVLGASHTTARGNKPRYASGAARMPSTVQLLESMDVDVVGLQEFEMVQYHALKRVTGDRYGVFPGPSMGRGPIRNSIAWRRDTWELLEARTTPIPYFRGKRVPMPYILLRHQESGRAAYFINIHNPTSNAKRGNNERWRDLGTRLETSLANRLHRETKLPVVLMGDFNERAEAFCRVTSAGLVAANGGRPGRPCVPPANMGIDWIFGTRDIEFSDYVRLDTPQVNRVTDHPMLVAAARVGP